jgi:uncharacterized protein YjiS (DUF1127 family)
MILFPILAKRADAANFAFLRGSLVNLLNPSRARTRRDLLELNDHLLRDVGLSRDDVWRGTF